MTEPNQSHDEDSPNPWEPEVREENRPGTESWARAMFSAWLSELDPAQLAALVANWKNVIEDAALDRVDSWVIAGRAITRLRSGPERS